MTPQPNTRQIETQLPNPNLEEIAYLSDGLMVARGDLCLSIPFERLPQVQRQIITVAQHYVTEENFTAVLYSAANLTKDYVRRRCRHHYLLTYCALKATEG